MGSRRLACWSWIERQALRLSCFIWGHGPTVVVSEGAGRSYRQCQVCEGRVRRPLV